MILHLEELNLSKDEKERVAELHQTYGFIVYNAGFSATMEEGRKVEMCYWRCLRGVRESALFPTHEAAWRDALRVHDEAVDAVKANPGVTRVKAMPGKEAAELSRLKRHAEAQGYTFKKGSIGEGQCWVFQGMTEGGHDTHAKAIRGAIKHWARRDPEGVVKRFITAWDNAAKTDPAETSARAAGWTNFEDSEDASLLVVAHDNRDVHFTGPEAWEQACQWEKDNELWNGVGQPPPGTVLWITPHNTLWGFNIVDVYLCEVMMYDGEHVWLKLLSDLGHDIGKYTTTRIDKVDVKVWKGNKDA